MSGLGILVTVLAAVATVIANTLLQHGLKAVPPETQGMGKLMALCVSPAFLVGLVFYVLAMLPWFWVISREPLDRAYPLLIGTVFVLLFLTSSLLYGEQLSVSKIAGAALIVLGIVCVGRN